MHSCNSVASHIGSQAKTLYDKLWAAHTVIPESNEHPALIYIDLHLIHEVTSPQAFEELRNHNLSVRRPDKTFATIDHAIPTDRVWTTNTLPLMNASARDQISQLMQNCRASNIELYGLGSTRRGIVHVMAPELGLTRPGMTIVCGDSHTSTHGAFGALAFGIGTSEIRNVLATQCLLLRKSKNMEVKIEGKLAPHVSAKDVILHIIATVGVSGATGHVIEYTGSAVRAMSMEERMTLCNMSIEAGARAGLIAPDEVTAAYLQDRNIEMASEWSQLKSDPHAKYDRQITIDASDIPPMISYGTTPAMSMGITQRIPDAPAPQVAEALVYMGFAAGEPLMGKAIDTVFIGSCTNGRLTDLERAAEILRGRRIASTVKMLIVPGSQQVKLEAERRGLHNIFIEAGAEWREAGCSMCLAMNGDQGKPHELIVSTSNRNFQGRQGTGARTILTSPATAAACGLYGRIVDVREEAI